MVEEISVFFPVFNEERNLERLVKLTSKTLNRLAKKYEILIINDGSTDRTKEVAREISSKNRKVKVVTHEKNFGYGKALRSGLSNATYPLICFTDSDGQFDFSEVEKFLNTSSADLMIGYRITRVDSFHRVFLAKIYNLLLRILFNLRVKDPDCGFKLVKRRALDRILPLKSEGAFISGELLIKAKRTGLKFKEIGVNHYPRKHGVQTGAKLKVIFGAFKEMLRFYFRPS